MIPKGKKFECCTPKLYTKQGNRNYCFIPLFQSNESWIAYPAWSGIHGQSGQPYAQVGRVQPESEDSSNSSPSRAVQEISGGMNSQADPNQLLPVNHGAYAITPPLPTQPTESWSYQAASLPQFHSQQNYCYYSGQTNIPVPSPSHNTARLQQAPSGGVIGQPLRQINQ